MNHNDHDDYRYRSDEYRHDRRSQQYDHRAQQYSDDPYYRGSYSDEADDHSHHNDYRADDFPVRPSEPVEPTFDAPFVDDAEYFGDQPEYDEALYHSSASDDAEYMQDYDERDPNVYPHSSSAPNTLYAEDFYDSNHQSNNRLAKSLSKIGFGLAAVVFVAAFTAITFIASKPQMTPEEIVQMDGYRGSGGVQTMYFNLASLRGCDNTQDCDGVIRSKDTDPDSAGSTGLAAQQKSATSQQGNPQSASGKPNYREIPAVAIQTDSSIAAPETPESSTWLVRQQWSIVREQPDMSSAIVTSIAANKRVEVIDQVGDWYQIRHESVGGYRTGYMHRSLLQKAP